MAGDPFGYIEGQKSGVIPFFDRNGAWAPLGVGSAGQIVGVTSGLPAWQSAASYLGAALTKTDDTNVTLTLGGTPTTALLTASSITVGWPARWP